ncbi:hypothetical protein PO909_018939 [Leuciscus waleckii]
MQLAKANKAKKEDSTRKGGPMPQQIQVQSSSADSSPEMNTVSTATVSLPATIVTTSVPTSMAGHMMYPSSHTVMYASGPTLADGGLVLNAFSQGPVSHAQTQDTATILNTWLKWCSSGVPHGSSWNGSDSRLSGAASSSTARSTLHK